MAATSKPVPLREQVQNLLVLHRSGLHDDALKGAVTLAEIDRSAMVLNLVGDLRLDAFIRSRDSDPEAARKHGQCAIDAYKSATVAAPNCLKTSAAYVGALSHMKEYLLLLAQDEISRSNDIQVVDDPRIHHVSCDLDGQNTSKEDCIVSVADELTLQIGKHEASCETDDTVQVPALPQSSGADFTNDIQVVDDPRIHPVPCDLDDQNLSKEDCVAGATDEFNLQIGKHEATCETDDTVQVPALLQSSGADFAIDIHDPRIHCVTGDLDGQNLSKEDCIASDTDEFNLQIGKHEASCETDDTVQVLALLKTSGGDFVVAAASEVAKRYPHSARAQYLEVYVQMELVGTLSRDVERRKDLLQQAVNNMRTLASTFEKSLVISLCYAKLLIITGNYIGADTECSRVLNVDNLQDPKVDPVPLGLFSGEDNSDRSITVKNDVNALRKLLSIQLRWSLMTIQQWESLTSVKVEMLIEHFSSISPSTAEFISNAIRHFKKNNSWNLYICPFPDSECNGFWDGNARHLDRHMLMQHSHLFAQLPSSLAEKASVDQGVFGAVFLGQDSEWKDIFRFRSLDDMLQSLLLLSSAREPPSMQAMRLKVCREATGVLESLRNESNELIEEMWIKLFETSSIDYRIGLLPLVSLLKMEEIKNSGDMFFDSLANFDWSFSGEKKELQKSDAAMFDSLGDFVWTSPSKGIQQEEVTTYVAANIDYLSDPHWTIPSEHVSTSGGIMDSQNEEDKHEEMEKNISARFDSFGDLFVEGGKSLDDLDWTFPGEQFSNPSGGECDDQSEVDKQTCGQGVILMPDKGLRESDVSIEDTKSVDPPTAVDENAMKFTAKQTGRPKAPGPRSQSHQAALYKISALHRPMAERVETPPMSPFDKDWEAQKYDPYMDKLVHEQYHDELVKRAPAHVCSVCYFEKNRTNEVKQIFHYYEMHKAFSIKCKFCSARFILQRELDSHITYCHEKTSAGPSSQKKKTG